MPFTACLTNTQQKLQRHTTPPPPQSRQQQGHYKKTKDNNPQKPGCRQMLASTIHMSNTPPTNPRPAHHTARPGKGGTEKPTHPTTGHPPHQAPSRGHGPDSSGPNSVPKPQNPKIQDPKIQDPSPPPHRPPPGSTPQLAPWVVLRTDRPAGRGRSSMIPLVNTTNATRTDVGRAGCVLLRKEVIQPHLPVRLPCYDFVPIASPTFDGSPHKGWATGFGCCRLS